MKNKFIPNLFHRNSAFTVAIVALLASHSAQAGTFTWDPLLTTTGSDGSGNWDNVTANWASSGADTFYQKSGQTSNTVAIVIGQSTITVASATGLAVGQMLSNAAFAVGTTITAIDTGTNIVTLSTPAIAALAINSQIHFSFNDDAVIGSAQGEAGTITVVGSQAADSLVLNPPGVDGIYNLTAGAGGAITVSARNGSTGAIKVLWDGTISSPIAMKNIQFQASGRTLNLTGGSVSGSAINAFNGAVNGTTALGVNNAAFALTSTLNVSGTYTANSNQQFNIGDPAAETAGFRFSAGTITTTGAFEFGRSASGYAVFSGSAVVNSTGQLNVGRSNSAVSGKLVIDGGAMNSIRTGGGNDVEAQIGRDNGVGILNVKSGIFNVFNASTAGGVVVINSNNTTTGVTTTGGTLNLSGGTTTIEEIRFNGGNNHDGPNSSNGSGTLNITGGTLYIGGTVKLANTPAVINGAGGIVNRGTGTSAYAINLSGGTVGAGAAWNSSLNITLGTTNGNVTFKAATAADVASDIGLGGVLSGAGGLTKTGAGILTLSGANSYTGNTVIGAGKLALSGTGSIATSPVIDVQSGATFDVGASTFNLGAGQTLKGTGTVTGPITAAGTIAPGASAGTLTTGATTLTGTLAVEINGATGDKLLSTGALNISGATLTVALLPGGFSQVSYVIAEGTSLTGTFASVPAGYSVSYSATQATLTQAAGGNYATWATANGISGEPASGDFDHDGLTNLVEYALGKNPTVSSQPPGSLAGGVLTFTKGSEAIANGDVSYVIEQSTDLVSWSPVVTQTAPNASLTISYTLPTGQAKEFARLKVIKQP